MFMENTKRKMARAGWPWQATLASFVAIVAIFPAIVGFLVMDATGSNAIAVNATMTSHAMSIAIVLVLWWIESRHSKN